MPDLPTTDPEITSFLCAFEACTLPKEYWTHSAHLFTGACYVHAHGAAEAMEKMRANLRKYNESVGGQNTDTGGYHETITVAWIKLLDALHREHPGLDRTAFAALAVEHFAPQKDIFAQFYDFDLVQSTEARRTWIEPNIKSLP